MLAKILSLTSLTGFFDTLQGKGIQFSLLRAPFTLTKDVITVKDAKTHGDAIGMTAEGTITFPKRTLDLQGTIVPSYSLNNVVGKVPLVGKLLTGGEGQGVFAARYSVKGTEERPGRVGQSAVDADARLPARVVRHTRYVRQEKQRRRELSRFGNIQDDISELI